MSRAVSRICPASDRRGARARGGFSSHCRTGPLFTMADERDPGRNGATVMLARRAAGGKGPVLAAPLRHAEGGRGDGDGGPVGPVEGNAGQRGRDGGGAGRWRDGGGLRGHCGGAGCLGAVRVVQPGEFPAGGEREVGLDPELAGLPEPAGLGVPDRGDRIAGEAGEGGLVQPGSRGAARPACGTGDGPRLTGPSRRGGTATRGRAFALGPGTRVPSLTRMRSALRQVSGLKPVSRASCAPLGAASPGLSVPSATCARTIPAACAYLGSGGSVMTRPARAGARVPR